MRGWMPLVVMMTGCMDYGIVDPDGENPDGFTTGINDGRSYHYWKGNRQYQNRTHSFSVERALLRRLAHEKYISFVEGKVDTIKSFV